MKKTVLLDLAKLKYLYNGLGQVSYQLGKKLGEYNTPEIDFYYLLPKRFDTVFSTGIGGPGEHTGAVIIYVDARNG